MLPKHFPKILKLNMACQVKVRSKVKIGLFRLRILEISNVTFFSPKTFHMHSKDQAKVLKSDFFFIFSSGQGQVIGHQTQNFQMSHLSHVSWSHFGRKNSIVTVLLQFDFI